MDLPYELTVSVALALILVDKIMYWVNKARIRKNGDTRQPPKSADWYLVMRQVRELHEWHDMVDADGVKVWYVKQSLPVAIEKMTEAIEALIRSNELSHAVFERIATRLEAQ